MWLVNLFRGLLRLFGKKKHVKLGLYGPPNGGKTTLANRICSDWLGEEMGSTSRIPHETRKLYRKDRVTIMDEEGRQLTFSLVDTPGLASRIDFRDFVREGMGEDEAKLRAMEASQGVLQSVRWLDDADAVVVVLDATKEPQNQVNRVLLEALSQRNIPFMVLANKIDLRKSSTERVQSAFSDQEVLGISARYGENIEKFYNKLFELTERVE